MLPSAERRTEKKSWGCRDIGQQSNHWPVVDTKSYIAQRWSKPCEGNDQKKEDDGLAGGKEGEICVTGSDHDG